MTQLHPQLAALEAEFRAATEHARQLVGAVDESQFHARPDPERWSIAECLAHLNLTSAAFLPLLHAAFAEGRAAGLAAPKRHRRDLMGWFLSRATEPPVRTRVKTPPPFVPESAGTKQQVLDEFVAGQERLIAALHDANGLDLGKLRIVSPFNERFKYNPYSAFRILAAHERRHLWQAEQARAKLLDPTRSTMNTVTTSSEG